MSILTAVIVLGCIGAVGAVALNILARRFHVHEDERIALFEQLLPGANCGGCGRKGCHDAAVDCVSRGTIEGFNCPVAGQQGMARIAEFMGCESQAKSPEIAVVKCAGTKDTKTALNASYSGPRSCSLMAQFAGDFACLQSCLGCGDCTEVCPFDAIAMYPGIDTPVVDADKCTGCGKCVTTCPKNIIELRPKGVKSRRVWVACSNCAKGALTRKQCTVGCIGCGICARTCPFGAITVKDNLAWIDPAKCKTCGKCVPVCPTHAIQYANITIRQKNEEVDV